MKITSAHCLESSPLAAAPESFNVVLSSVRRNEVYEGTWHLVWAQTHLASPPQCRYAVSDPVSTTQLWWSKFPPSLRSSVLESFPNLVHKTHWIYSLGLLLPHQVKLLMSPCSFGWLHKDLVIRSCHQNVRHPFIQNKAPGNDFWELKQWEQNSPSHQGVTWMHLYDLLWNWYVLLNILCFWVDFRALRKDSA